MVVLEVRGNRSKGGRYYFSSGVEPTRQGMNVRRAWVGRIIRQEGRNQRQHSRADCIIENRGSWKW